MQPLTIYFNELCLVKIRNPSVEYQAFSDCARLLNKFFSIRTDGKVAYSENSKNHIIAQMPFFMHFESYLKRDQYRRLLSRLKNVVDTEIPLDRDVEVDGVSSLGLTLADLAAIQSGNGWAISLPLKDSPWLHPHIEAHRSVLNQQAIIEKPVPCKVAHLSLEAHLGHWQQELQDWGTSISVSSKLDELDGHPIVMYSSPREHGPAHVHLLASKTNNKTLAKYRIEDFCRYEGQPIWDTEMQHWITTYRDQLLRSWERCQKGHHPYELKKQ